MRRTCRDRLFLAFIASITFYIGWYILNSTPHVKRDPAEEQAYLHAVGGSLPMVQNVQLCSLDEVDLLILVISSGSHFVDRQSIRETWGSMPDMFDVHSQCLFVVGYQYGANLYRDLVSEAQHQQDLLYLTVDDNSMTMKELHAYRWLEKYCPNVTYTFKTEDDLFLNTFLLHEIVRELKTNSEQYQNRYLHNISLDSLFLARINSAAHAFLFGWAFQPGKPERNQSMAPYYVSYQEYPKELYPRYCSGFGYFMDSKTRKLLVLEGFKDKEPFRFSDIFITGILPERMNFFCDVLPFTYNQGTTDQCLNIIMQSNKRNTSLSTPPMIVCSTGRHVAQNAFSDYYRIWTGLKYAYGDRTDTKRGT
jgi:beta-1,3-galactosyltransferase 1